MKQIILALALIAGVSAASPEAFAQRHDGEERRTEVGERTCIRMPRTTDCFPERPVGKVSRKEIIRRSTEGPERTECPSLREDLRQIRAWEREQARKEAMRLRKLKAASRPAAER